MMGKGKTTADIWVKRKQRIADLEARRVVARDRLTESLKYIVPGVHNPEFCESYGEYAETLAELDDEWVFDLFKPYAWIARVSPEGQP